MHRYGVIIHSLPTWEKNPFIISVDSFYDVFFVGFDHFEFQLYLDDREREVNNSAKLLIDSWWCLFSKGSYDLRSWLFIDQEETLANPVLIQSVIIQVYHIC